jgi:hypothetical protein
MPRVYGSPYEYGIEGGADFLPQNAPRPAVAGQASGAR